MFFLFQQCGAKGYPAVVVVPSEPYATDEQYGIHLDLQREGSGCSVSSTTPLMTNQVMDDGKYTTVVPSSSALQPPLPLVSTVQYAGVDIRATHVS